MSDGGRIAVLKGGASLERQVSLRSGSRVTEALRSRGYDVTEIDVDETLVARLTALAPDAVFIALHGRGGEDGTVQELAELLGLPYTGCGVLASINCMDKAVTKLILQREGIATPRFVTFNDAAFRGLGAAGALSGVGEKLGFPVVVKPARQGSALGVKFAPDQGALPAALVSAFSYDDRLLIEQFVRGREIAVTVLDGEALPAVEALPTEQDFYDFESRYEIGKTNFVCPAKLDADVADSVARIAERTFEQLGCHGFARIDFMVPEDGEPQVLEVNSIPGMTDTSLMPMAAEAVGISFPELAERLLRSAHTRSAYPLNSVGA